MPRYQVLNPGFYAGQLYDPQGKRKTLTTDKAFKKCPSWLKPIKGETAAQRKQREAAEAEQAKADAEKQAEDQIEIDAVTFTEPPKSAQVETL